MQFSSPIDPTSGLWDDYQDMAENPATSLDAMFVEVANLLADGERPSALITELDSDEIEPIFDTVDFLERAEATDSRLATWPDSVPANWIPIQVPAARVPESVVDASFYGDSCDVYPDIIICSTWNEWRVARLKVLGLIASAGNYAAKYQAMQTIQQMADGICASVPFSLGDRTALCQLYDAQVTYPTYPGRASSKEHQRTASAYGPWYLFAPFKQLIQVAMYLREGQRDWVRKQLFRLAFISDVTPA